MPQCATEHRDTCSETVRSSATPRPHLTGQEEGVQQLRGCSRVVSGGSTSGTVGAAGDTMGGGDWGRTDGNTSPVCDLYLESICWCLLEVVFLSEEFPILVLCLGQPAPVIVNFPSNT